MDITAYSLASRFVGLREVPGVASNPQILSMLRLDAEWPEGDEVAWCSAFVNYICWLLRLPRSKSLAARSWLTVGTPIEIHQASVGFDVVILQRGDGAPGPDVLNAPGHVGFFAGRTEGISGFTPIVWLLGGNQNNSVSVGAFDANRILGIRRLMEV